MPDCENIKAPITLLAPGRSGTSLLSGVFDCHPDFTTVGETVNLIFGSWQAVEFSSPGIAPLVEERLLVAEDERNGRVVRNAFTTCFPEKSRFWFHKPIGVPTSIIAGFGPDQWAEAGAWYWRVMRSSFPAARYFTVLRHPCDIVISSKKHWGYDEATIWWSLALLASLLTHEDSLLDYGVRYADLVADRQMVLEKLFAYLELPFSPRVLEAFARAHAPSAGRETAAAAGRSRRAEWDTLDPLELNPAYRACIEKYYGRFGFDLEWPESFTAPAEPLAAEKPQLSREARLEETVQQLNRRIEELHLEFGEKLRRRESELKEAYIKRLRSYEAQYCASVPARMKHLCRKLVGLNPDD